MDDRINGQDQDQPLERGQAGSGLPDGLLGYTRAPALRERLMKAAMAQQEGSSQLKRLADRLTPEIQETIEVLQEGIQLGVFSLNGGVTRY